MTKKIIHVPQHAVVSGTPATPDAGFSKIYMKPDLEWYWLDENGTEVPFKSDIVINYPLAVYVDPVNGNNATAQKYIFNKPYQTYAAAQAAAVSGDLIVLRPGVYPGGVMALKNGVNIYCEAGTDLRGGFYDNGVAVTVKILGDANFSGSGQDALRITGDGSNIHFSFDRIVGTRPQGIMIDHNGACTLTAVGNIIQCTLPIRIKNGIKTVNIKVNHLISSFGNFTIRLGSSSLLPLVGSYHIECPIIENTSATFARSCLYLSNLLSEQVMPGQNYKITVKGKMRTTNLTMTETRPNIISSCIWIDGGDNVEIIGDLEGNACLAVCNRGGGATPVYGSIVINGNVSSNIECISSNIKFATGNGWANVIFKNGLIKSLGLGASGSLVESSVGWNVIHGGIVGDIQFLNCVLYNASAGGKIVQNDVDSPSIKNVYFYNCLAFVEGVGGYFASSTQPAKEIGMHNVRSNKDNDIMIADPFVPSGFIFDTNLIIPKK